MSVNDGQGIRAAQGKLVAIKGRVQNVGQTRTGTIQFINFQGNTRGQFCGIIRAANQEAVVTGLGANIKSALSGKTVELKGKVMLFEGTPQIEITRSDQVKVIAP
jgi:DNA/RNA endonuclease YhcR with UshA esterase domain